VRKVTEGTIITLNATGILSRLNHWNFGKLDHVPLEEKLTPSVREDSYLIPGKRVGAKTAAEFTVFTPQHRYLFPFDLQDVPLP
jgi:hypothetical protein